MNDDQKIISIGHIDLNQTEIKGTFCPGDLPVVPLRDMVLFPGVTFPIIMGRDLTVKTVTEASQRNLQVGVFCQQDASLENPGVADLYPYGVLAEVIKVLELPDGTSTAILQALEKVKITGPGEGNLMPQALTVSVETCHEGQPRPSDKEFTVLLEDIRTTTMRILKEAGDPHNAEIGVNLPDIDSPALLINMVCTHAAFPTDDKQALLRRARLKDRASMLMAMLARQEMIMEMRAEIRRKAMRNIDQQQKNHLLQHEFEVMREKLYGSDDDSVAFEKKAASLPLPEPVKETVAKEIDKLRRLNPQSPDYSVQYSYLQLLTDLPWGKEDAPLQDFGQAEAILEADHYGLDKVKERILEQLAVMMHTPGSRSPILCLVGAPGVGKTSLGQSIAKALGRKYQRVSLGGLHDEAEIRGHRRTYIGAMPGRIIDAVKRAGTVNPVLLLDEIDKTGRDFKGDPSSALLEVLDPEQNSRFHDNYVDVDFDLSHVMFVATANTLSTIPGPLLDRMEVIDISGYLPEEKIEIASRHLLPRLAAQNGFAPGELTFTPRAIRRIIEAYTAESGVRQLEKQLAKAVRRTVLDKMRGNDYTLTVDEQHLRRLLGVERYNPERYEAPGTPGVAVGLAWTAAGGEILFIESSFTPGKGEKLTLTGNLGDVMKESALLALQVVRAHAAAMPSVGADWFDTHALHIHVPEGAIPKDGPSAGITLAVSIRSALTGQPVRERLAMTGELTLRGKVLPVGGIKEKILAAKRAGITDIILCEENRKDLEDIRPVYLKGVDFHFVRNIGEVFGIAFDTPGSDAAPAR